MTTPIRLAAALSLLPPLMIFGCAHDNGPTANLPRPAEGTGVPEGVTNAQNTADLRIAGRLADARCERAMACNDVGAGKTYVSRELCMQQVRGNIANDLTGYSCPHGLDNGAVDRCAAAIDGEACGSSRESVSHMTECKTDVLCLR
jgi:Family of unknown function (DUF6184)